MPDTKTNSRMVGIWSLDDPCISDSEDDYGYEDNAHYCIHLTDIDYGIVRIVDLWLATEQFDTVQNFQSFVSSYFGFTNEEVKIIFAELDANEEVRLYSI